MGCTLNKFDRYPVKEIIKDNGTGRTLVKLGVDIPTCPDGVLNNSHTKIVEDAKAAVSVLSFDDHTNTPIVLRSLNTPITVIESGTASIGVQAGESMNSSFGFGSFALLVIVAIALYFIARKVFRSVANQQSAYAGDAYARNRFSNGNSSTTIVNTGSGGGHTSGLVEGAIMGVMADRLLSGSNDKSYSSGSGSSTSSSDKSSDYSLDSGSSYSSDSSSSDSSSSFDSDSSISFGSDSSSSFGSDSGSSSFGND